MDTSIVKWLLTCWSGLADAAICDAVLVQFTCYRTLGTIEAQAMSNKELATYLKQIAVYKELAGENPFKALAFEKAGLIVERHSESFVTLVKDGDLAGIQGIGKGTGEVISELVNTGRSSLLDELKAAFPPGLEELLTLSGLGPKRVRALWRHLGIGGLGELEYACRENRLVSLEGFGQKTQQKLLKAIAFRKQYQAMHLYAEAAEIVTDVLTKLQESELFERMHVAGSLRRGKRILKDADILLIPRASSVPHRIQAALTTLADTGNDIEGVLTAGETKVSIRCKGLQVDFRLVPAVSEPSALQHFTGSREHNTILRGRAKAMGLKMNEYGVFRGGESLVLADEEAVYGRLGLPLIPPEIREGEEEVEAAEAGMLPRLVEARDIKGVIHVHTAYSDGLIGIEEMARACRRLGYKYVFLSDHSRSAAYAGGLSIERLRQQIEEVGELNVRLAPFRIFCGVESDILPDGSLDYPSPVLGELDFVIGSIHLNLNMGPEAATSRLVRAISNPQLTILGHPSGALLLLRAGYEYDELEVFTALRDNGVVLEHNCNPHRLDPDWPALKRAARMGIQVALCPDAHSDEHLAYMAYGVLMARKAWIEPNSILNCMDTHQVEVFLKRRSGR